MGFTTYFNGLSLHFFVKKEKGIIDDDVWMMNIIALFQEHIRLK